jgi:hypothetical protein
LIDCRKLHGGINHHEYFSTASQDFGFQVEKLGKNTNLLTVYLEHNAVQKVGTKIIYLDNLSVGL